MYLVKLTDQRNTKSHTCCLSDLDKKWLTNFQWCQCRIFMRIQNSTVVYMVTGKTLKSCSALLRSAKKRTRSQDVLQDMPGKFNQNKQNWLTSYPYRLFGTVCASHSPHNPKHKSNQPNHCYSRLTKLE